MRLSESVPVVRPPVVLIVALVVACLSCQAPADPDGSRSGEPSGVSMVARSDEGAVIAAHRELIRAFQEGDTESALGWLVPNESLSIFHPFLENRFDGYEEAREGLARMLDRIEEMEWTEVHQTVDLDGNVAWLTSQILIRTPSLEPPFIGRGTEIWVRLHGKWRLSHAHWSEHARLAGTRQDD